MSFADEKKALYHTLNDIDSKLFNLKHSIEAGAKNIISLKMHTDNSAAIDSYIADLKSAIEAQNKLNTEFQLLMKERSIIAFEIRNLITHDFNEFLRKQRESTEQCHEVGKVFIVFMLALLGFAIYLSLSKKVNNNLVI